MTQAPQPAPAPDQLSPANRRAVDAMRRRLEERLLIAQEAGESGELEVAGMLALHRGHARAVRWRQDEHLALDNGAAKAPNSAQT